MAVVDDLAPGMDASPPSEDYGRQPPQDLAAEQSVLGGMLLSKDAIADVLERLRPGDFYRPAHQNVYDAILDLYGRGEPADAVTVAAELDRRGLLRRIGGAPYLHTLISTVPTAANAGYYAGIVAEKALLRRLVEAGTRVVQYGYAGAEGADVAEVVDRAQAEIYDVADRRLSEDFVPLEDLLQPTMDEIDAIASSGGLARGVPTGFTELDEVTNGLHPGQMIIVAARPGVGKALALDTPLPTPTGWTTMGDVAVGDELLAADGQPTRVVAATDVMLGRPCYEVEFSDGTVIVADAAHQWLTETRASRKSAQAAAVGYNRCKNQRTFAAVRTTAEIAGSLRCDTRDRRLNHSVVNARALDLPDREFLIPPYTLGAWLGDGTSAAAQITTADPEIIMRIEADGFAAVRSESAHTVISCVYRLAPSRFLASAWYAVRSSFPKPVRCGPVDAHAVAGHGLSLLRCRVRPALVVRDRRQGCGCAGSAAPPWGHCRRDCEHSACSATSTFRWNTCGGPRRSGAPCSPACSTPTEPWQRAAPSNFQSLTIGWRTMSPS